MFFSYIPQVSNSGNVKNISRNLPTRENLDPEMNPGEKSESYFAIPVLTANRVLSKRPIGFMNINERIFMKTLFFFVASLLLASASAYATGTINLSINGTSYCAVAQSGNAFTGVIAGACTTPPPPPPTTCPDGRQTAGSIEFYGCGTNCPSTLSGQDLTRFETIWGRYAPGQTPAVWPGAHSYIYLLNFPRSKYIAAKFHTPASGGPTSGWISMPEYFAADMAMSISTSCGDFGPANISCFTPSVATHGIVRWTFGANTTGCHLQPNTDYYVNVKLANPNQTSPYCNNSSCNLGGINNF
jgi:hypothetical protein